MRFHGGFGRDCARWLAWPCCRLALLLLLLLLLRLLLLLLLRPAARPSLLAPPPFPLPPFPRLVHCEGVPCLLTRDAWPPTAS